MDHQMSLNPQVDEYTAEIRMSVKVSGEFYRRELTRIINESPGLDLTNTAAIEGVRAKLADPFYWKDKPQNKGTLLSSPSQQEETPKLPPPNPEKSKDTTKRVLLRDLVRTQAQAIPPYQWFEKLQEPMPEGKDGRPLTRSEKQMVWNRNYDVRRLLEKLRKELETGTFTLTPEAEEEEKRYQANQTEHLETTIKEVALASNGNRFH